MTYDYDLVIIGAGSAGMIAAEVAANMGVKTALAERARIGGDCLWTGCVPSKTLLASAKAAHTIRHAADYGVEAAEPTVDSSKVWERIKRVQDEIAETDDNADRYRELGVDVLTGEASFAGPHLIRAGEREVSAEYALVCTGSRPEAPPIEGMAEAGFLTSESVFTLERAPESLAIIGAGPIGVEMAQGMARLGVRTTLLEAVDRILERDEPALAEILAAILRREGVDLHTGVELERIERTGAGKVAHARVGGEARAFEAEEIFVATGRKPNVERLGLDAAGVATGKRGIRVNRNLRTSAAWVYAAGDCAGRYLFTHSAAAEAATALRNMFYPGLADAASPMPWTTFTDPELAHVGMTASEAKKRLGRRSVKTFEWDLARSDRARAEGATDGRIIVVTDSRFKVVGAHILAPSAGEMISQFTLAISKGVKLTPDFVNLVQVYPTFSTSVAQAATQAIYGQLQRPFLRAVKRLNRWFFN